MAQSGLDPVTGGDLVAVFIDLENLALGAGESLPRLPGLVDVKKDRSSPDMRVTLVAPNKTQKS